MQKIPQINKAQIYLEKALRQGRKVATSAKDSAKGTVYQRLKRIERERIKAIRGTLLKDLNNIVSYFPNFNNISAFYKELIATAVDVDKINKVLKKTEKSSEIIDNLSQKYLKRLRNRGLEIDDIKQITSQYIGRISSVIARLKNDFEYLEHIRKELRKIPNINENTFTIAIAGFPNVGKSTLLSKITTAKPEIKSYPFTTKGLNLGWINIKFHKVQVIDTPGTLARAKKNSIEKRAELVIKHVANLIIYVFDPTEEYTLKNQIRLLKKIDKGVPIISYISKKDIVGEEDIKKIINQAELKNYAKNINEIKEFIASIFKRQIHSQPQ